MTEFSVPRRLGGFTRVQLAELAVAVAVFVAAAVSLVVIHGASAAACGRSNLLVPRCDALWGVATDPNTVGAVKAVDRAAGTRFDLVYHFHDIDDTIPTADERALVAQKRLLHITLAPSNFTTGARITWSQISSGAYDAQLTKQARGLAALHVPVFVSFDHEMDRSDRTSSGTAAQFIAAWRHVHDVYERAGAKAVWVWVVTGYQPFFANAAKLWPGNRYVDWISWESYNGSGCNKGSVSTGAYRSFADEALPFYRWVHAEGPRYGIDANKPMMISEAGSYLYPQDPDLTADWYAGIPKVLKSYPQIKAVTLWDRPGKGACKYRFNDAPAVLDSVGRVSS